jgi:hypothetical protein
LVFTHRLGQRQASVVLAARVVEVRMVKINTAAVALAADGADAKKKNRRRRYINTVAVALAADGADAKKKKKKKIY